MAKKTKKKTGKGRYQECGACHKPGHNARSCGKKKTAKKAAKKGRKK